MFTEFTKRHHTAINDIITKNEVLAIITSERQHKNGTIAIYDSTTDITYTLHTSGYIRHNDDKGNGFWLGWGKRSWQLNRIMSINNRNRNTVVRILACADEQIVILINAIRRDHLAYYKQKKYDALEAYIKASDNYTTQLIGK